MSRAWAAWDAPAAAYDAKADAKHADTDGSMVQWARDLAEAQWLSMRPTDGGGR
jgi:hypothetical protein